jgi:hypothetical protein
MTIVGIRDRTGMDIIRIGAGGMVMGRITAADMAIAEGTEEISLPADQEQ